MFKLCSPPSLGLDDNLKALRLGKRKRTSRPLLTEPVLAFEDHEDFMDTLAMHFDHGFDPKTKMEKPTKTNGTGHIFVEDIVEPQ